MASAPPVRTARDGDVVAMGCHHCEVTWRGPRAGHCWSCGRLGVPAAPATTVVHDR